MRFAGNGDGARFRKGHLPLTIDRAVQALRDAAPKVENQAIAGAQHIIGSGGQIHGKFVGVPGAVAEDTAAEALEPGFGTGKL